MNEYICLECLTKYYSAMDYNDLVEQDLCWCDCRSKLYPIERVQSGELEVAVIPRLELENKLRDLMDIMDIGGKP